MIINIAKSAGFCFGVRRALKIASETLKLNKNVEMLGDIVHNEDVIEQIKKAGIKRVKKLTKGTNKTLLICAHGTAIKTFDNAQKLGYKIVDATCPMVKEIHKIVQEMENEYRRIIIIGDKKHDEVNGIRGHLKTKALVIDELKNIPLNYIRRIKSACVVVQSTQNLDKALKTVDVLKEHIKEVKFFNTICNPTRTKQQEIKKMPLKNDIMIIIGSKTSANTKRLYEISKALNQNTYWVQSKKDLKRKWFKDAQSVGITAGASTPDSITRDVVESISQIM